MMGGGSARDGNDHGVGQNLTTDFLIAELTIELPTRRPGQLDDFISKMTIIVKSAWFLKSPSRPGRSSLPSLFSADFGCHAA